MDPGLKILFRGRFPASQVGATLSGRPRPTTPELERHIEQRWEEALARAGREGRHLFDGRVLRLQGVVQATPDHIELEFGRARYREFVGTNLDASLRPDIAGGTVPWLHYGNVVGTSALLRTRDGRLVLGRRSEKVFGYPGYLHCLGGVLEGADETGATIDVFASMRRELHEELALPPAETQALELCALVIEPALFQPELLFLLECELTLVELRRRFEQAPSRDEHAALVDLPDDERAVESLLPGLAPVSGAARAALALYFEGGSFSAG